MEREPDQYAREFPPPADFSYALQATFSHSFRKDTIQHLKESSHRSHFWESLESLTLLVCSNQRASPIEKCLIISQALRQDQSLIKTRTRI